MLSVTDARKLLWIAVCCIHTRTHLCTLTPSYNSYRTTLCLQYDATHIAIGAIFLAAIKLDTKPLNRSKTKNQVERTWYELMETDIEEESLKSTYSTYIISLSYRRKLLSSCLWGITSWFAYFVERTMSFPPSVCFTVFFLLSFHVVLFSPSNLFLLSFKLDVCFQLLEALEDDYRPSSSSTSTSTIGVTGRGNDINRLTEDQDNPNNVNKAMQPNTNGSDGNNLNLVRWHEESGGNKNKMHNVFIEVLRCTVKWSMIRYDTVWCLIGTGTGMVGRSVRLSVSTDNAIWSNASVVVYVVALHCFDRIPVVGRSWSHTHTYHMAWRHMTWHVIVWHDMTSHDNTHTQRNANIIYEGRLNLLRLIWVYNRNLFALALFLPFTFWVTCLSSNYGLWNNTKLLGFWERK